MGRVQAPPTAGIQHNALSALVGDRQEATSHNENMGLWLRGAVLQALRGSRGFCRSPGRPSPLPAPQKVVATWEAINQGRQPVPEYFNFAHDVLDTWSQMEKVRPTLPSVHCGYPSLPWISLPTPSSSRSQASTGWNTLTFLYISFFIFPSLCACCVSVFYGYLLFMLMAIN